MVLTEELVSSTFKRVFLFRLLEIALFSNNQSVLIRGILMYFLIKDGFFKFLLYPHFPLTLPFFVNQ